MSMVSGTLAGGGTHIAPPSPNMYKRAIVRQAPNNFMVEVLSPMKQGNAYSYGIRVCPIRTTSDARSIRSNASDQEYEVWRRWEDCLDFQDTLEEQYYQMSRDKRRRLQAGKGVKKDGVYMQQNAAASFDSLPPGPDPNMIAKEIHGILPKLSKKSAVFRPSAALIEQRGKEFHALIDALMSEDVPMLIRELRDTRIVRDFFALWRRDREYEEKMAKGKGKQKSPTSSTDLSRSSVNMYFTASNNSLHTLPTSPAPPGSAGSNQSFSTPHSLVSGYPGSAHPSRRSEVPRPSITMPGGRNDTNNRFRAPASAPATGQFAIARPSLGQRPGSNPSSDEDNYAQQPSTPGRSRGVPLPMVGNVPADRRRYVGPPQPHDRVQIVSEDIPVIIARGGDFPESRQTSTISGLESLPEHADESYGQDLIQELPIPVPRTPKTPASIASANRQGLVFQSSPPVTPTYQNYGHEHDDDDDDLSSDTHTIDPSEVGLAYLRTEDSQDTLRREPAHYYPSSRPLSIANTLSSFATGSSGSSGSTNDAPLPRFSVPQSTRSSVSDMDLPDFTHDRSNDGTGIRMSMSSLFSSESAVDPEMPQRMQTPTQAPPPRPTRNPLRTAGRAMSAYSDDMSWHEQFMEGDDLIDSYLNSASPVDDGQHSLAHDFTNRAAISPPPRRPRNQSLNYYHQTPFMVANPAPPSTVRSSPRSPPPQLPPSSPSCPASTATRSSFDDASIRSLNNIAVKAILDNIIVVFRVPREISLKDARARLAEKFHAHAGGALSEYFSIAVGKPPPSNAGTTSGSMEGVGSAAGRKRSNSTASQVVDKLNVEYIFMESDWRTVIANAEDKLVLRVFNSKR